MRYRDLDHFDAARDDEAFGFGLYEEERPRFRLDRPTCTTAPDQRPQVAANSSAATQDHDPGRALRARGVAPS